VARVESEMIPLGTPAPDFSLPDPSGEVHSLQDAAESKAVVVAFICNHCPYVIHIADAFAEVTAELIDQGAAVFAINPNDWTSHPDDSPERMAEESRERGYRFPYLIDEDQSVARAYSAVCTPDLYVFDAERKLVYRGQFDSTRPSGDEPANGSDLKAAVEAVMIGEAVPEPQRPSAGCSIKWRAGS
jgi:peroxiredoxin